MGAGEDGILELDILQHLEQVRRADVALPGAEAGCVAWSAGASMRNNLWLRLFFLLVVIQAFTIGRALIWPELIAQNLPWPASTLNARFVAALYWMGAISALLSMVAGRFAEV